jgi:hypothetical protein
VFKQGGICSVGIKDSRDGLHHPWVEGSSVAGQQPPFQECTGRLTSSDRSRLTSWAWLMSFSFRFSTCQHEAGAQ